MRFEVWDVFTERAFGGNPLAVVWDEGLSDRAQRDLAREFGFSETTFVTDLGPEGTAVRILTPTEELPFAGHPLIGTACALAHDGMATPMTLRIGIGPVAAEAVAAHGTGHASFVAARPLERIETVDTALVADCLSLPDAALMPGCPRVSLGTPFVLARLADPMQLDAARPDGAAFERLAEAYPSDLRPAIYLWTRDGASVRARMLGCTDHPYEDPATGSAAATLAAWIVEDGGPAELVVRQGEAMGRPSRIETSVRLEGERAAAVRVGGAAVKVMEGRIAGGAAR